MVAIVVSLASTLIAATSPSSSSFLTKLRSSPSLRLSFPVSPLGCRRGKLMVHTIAKATLGLTLPSTTEPIQVKPTLPFTISHSGS